MRVAIYAIARDEALHVERFMSAVTDADVVVVADTGSTDGTPQLLADHGARVSRIHVSPWAFDAARNAALALVPSDVDVCISLDLDEVPQPGWRLALEDAWAPDTTRMRYPFIASWNADRTAGITFWNDRVHARDGYCWRLPVHEILQWRGPGCERTVRAEGFVVHHHPDETKCRAAYLPLLEGAVREAPDDPRLSHYLGREYGYHGRHTEAAQELQRSLNLPACTWPAQRAEACRLIGKALDALHQFDESPRWYWRAVWERSDQREPWVDLAAALYHRGDYAGGYYAAGRALTLTARVTDYFSEPAAWGALPHDLLSNCAWRLGLQEVALRHAALAAQAAPDDARLQQNLKLVEESVAAG